MSASKKFQLPTSADGGLVVEAASVDGRPCVDLLVVVGGVGNRIRLSPHEALAVAVELGAMAETQGKKYNQVQRLRRRAVGAAESEVLN